jgi:hypothetical protein
MMRGPLRVISGRPAVIGFRSKAGGEADVSGPIGPVLPQEQTTFGLGQIGYL